MSDLARVGYEGQKYRVEGLRRLTGEWESIGWTNQEDGGPLVEMVNAWPAYCDVRVVEVTSDDGDQ